MTNEELFRQYGTEKWIIEQNLCFLLQIYWEENCAGKHGNGTMMPENPVSFVKKFMKEETLCETHYAEMSKMKTVADSVIEDATYTELN